MRIEAVAKLAGVGKPAIYRRLPHKPALVAHVISRQSPTLVPPDLGVTQAELWQAVEPRAGSRRTGLPAFLAAGHRPICPARGSKDGPGACYVLANADHCGGSNPDAHGDGDGAGDDYLRT